MAVPCIIHQQAGRFLGSRRERARWHFWRGPAGVEPEESLDLCEACLEIAIFHAEQDGAEVWVGQL